MHCWYKLPDFSYLCLLPRYIWGRVLLVMSRNILNATAEHSIAVNLAGLNSQILYIPAIATHKKHEILLVYGHFGTLSNYYNLANDLAKYGNVTVADLPGFNNHQSLYKIHDKPTICLLYTSDAADDLLCVDLGGRRI